VAEQLGLEQRFAEGGAVEREQRPSVAARFLVQRLGDDLLAHARLAQQEHVDVAVRGALELVVELVHSRVRDHHAGGRPGSRRRRARAGGPARRRRRMRAHPALRGAEQPRAYRREQLDQLERLRHIVVRSEIHPDPIVLTVRLGRQEDERHAGGGRMAAHALEHLVAVHAGHQDVTDHQIGRAALRERQAIAAVLGRSDVEALFGQ
jgi:hypothetical protein